MKYEKQAASIAKHFQTVLSEVPEGVNVAAIQERLPLTVAMSFEAGAIALPIYRDARKGKDVLGLTDKGDRADGYSSPVTLADGLVYDREVEIYSSAFPEDKFEGEEGERTVKDGKITFVEDEIDGTQNFAVGSGGFSYVNALYAKSSKTREDEHMTSLVYDPLQRVLFVAVRGRGAKRFELTSEMEITHERNIQVANLDVRTSKFPPFIMMDTMGLGEDPVLRRVLQNLGYKAEPQSGSGLKVAVVSSESMVCGMFRSQRGNPDPWDIAAASLLVTEGQVSGTGWGQNRGLATSVSGKKILTPERKFYDGYAIGAPLAHSHIVAANILIEEALTKQGVTQNDMSPKQWDQLAVRIAAMVREQCF